MNVNQNNQEIDLFAIPETFKSVSLKGAKKLREMADIPARATHVLIQCKTELTYALTAADAPDGFSIPAGTQKIFSRRDALGVYLNAAGNGDTVKIQPLSHD